MNIFVSIFLGIVQGLTEFLPVSSSGHLVIAQSLFTDFHQPGVLYDVVLHAGTLFAVLIYFRKKIFKLSAKYISFIILGTIPAIVIGLLFDDYLESSFGSIFWVGIQLIITGILNWFIDKAKSLDKPIDYKKSLWIGIWQAIAIIPGISRSGSTIFAGVTSGISREKAAEFSFLLSIPAITGAIVLQVFKYGGSDSINIPFYFIGFLVSFVVGFFSIGVLLNFLYHKHFKYFAVYSIILGVILIILS